MIADYIGDPIERATATEMIATAERFVAVMRERLVSNTAPQKAPHTKVPSRDRDGSPQR